MTDYDNAVTVGEFQEHLDNFDEDQLIAIKVGAVYDLFDKESLVVESIEEPGYEYSAAVPLASKSFEEWLKVDMGFRDMEDQ